MARDTWLNAEQLQQVQPQLQAYLSRELDVELGAFEAQFLIEFLAERIGPVLYNQAVADAQKVLAKRWTSLEDELWQLEKPAS